MCTIYLHLTLLGRCNADVIIISVVAVTVATATAQCCCGQDNSMRLCFALGATKMLVVAVAMKSASLSICTICTALQYIYTST